MLYEVITNCDSGYACPYANNIAWAGPTSPVAKETRPKSAFDRLFAGYDPGASQARMLVCTPDRLIGFH